MAVVMVCTATSHVSVADVSTETPSNAAGTTQTFSLEDVEELARKKMSEVYAPPSVKLNERLARLDADTWSRLLFKPKMALWSDEHLPFTVEFFPPGFIYEQPVRIHIADTAQITEIRLSKDMFESRGAAAGIQTALPDQFEAAGFRLLYPLSTPERHSEVASFLGATFFSALGRHATKGIYARGLALDMAMPDGEEFPRFTDFWLVKPAPDADTIQVYALMDSPSMTGAYSFMIQPGTSTIMDVVAVLFPRNDAKSRRKMGLAPLNSMFFFSETSRCRFEDYRPEAHNSDGLLYSTGRGIWFWRPLENPERLTVSGFALDNPRGFGLLQRDNAFDHYQDIGSRFETRSSLWVEPQGDWGQGHLELVEIPTRDDIHDNIAAYWVPGQTENGADTTGENSGSAVDVEIDPDSFRFSYRLFWMTPGVSPHTLGRVESTRIVRGQERELVRFIIDFESESLKSLPGDTGLTSVLELPENVQLIDKQLEKNPVTGGWRLGFRIRLPKIEGVIQNFIPPRDVSTIRFRALLKRGENLPDPISEIWQYDLAP